MTRMSLASRSGYRIWLSSRPTPRVLKSENIGSMPQRRPSWAFRVIERGEITRGLGHSDDPGLLVTGVLDEADVGAHLAGCQFHPRQVGCAPGQLLDRPRVSTVDTSAQVALQPQPVVPIQRLAAGDQGGRAVEPISQ